MIGKVKTTRAIPAGAVIQYDEYLDQLVIFDDETEQVYVLSMPFVVLPDSERDRRVERL